MHKVLWDGIIKCRKSRDKRNADEIPAYCACCPLGIECAMSLMKEKKEVN